VIWGLTPIYFKLLRQVPATEIIAHRVLWSVIFLLGGLLLRRKIASSWRALTAPGNFGWLLLTAVLISANWLLFVWAVNAGRVLDTSLGYFMMPLMYVLMGWLLLREKLRRWQWLAVALAALGVALRVAESGGLPWISLFLAVSFGAYGLVRKRLPIDAVSGLFAETLVTFPLALGFLLFLATQGQGHFGTDGVWVSVLLAAAGPITAVPLVLFAVGARRLRLVTLGFIQYIAPSLTFLLAVFVYGEPFNATQAVAFALIWLALLIFTLDLRASSAEL
jgi:chloramphenicol-sensitive protein RarD